MSDKIAGKIRWRIATVGWLAVIGWCTLRPAPEQAAAIASLKWYCVVCGDSGVADVLLNILLFLPLGAILHAQGWPFRRTLLVVAAISTSIELIQGQFLVGRDASIGDVLSNATGGGLGWFGYLGGQALRRPTVSMARRGTVATLGIMTMLWLATGAGLQPSLTGRDPWIGQPAHIGRGPQPFPGTLHRATIDGIEIPNDEMPSRAPWRDSIAIELNATRTSGEIFNRGIVLLRIVDTAQNVEVAMDQRGEDAWLRLRLRGADWLLHNPRWLVKRGMRMTPNVPWRFRWTWLRDRFTIVNEPMAGPHNRVVAVPLSIGLGWVFIHPFTSLVDSTRLLWTVLWLAFWFGLLGWLAGRLGAQASTFIGVTAIAIYAGVSLFWGMPVLAGEVAAAIIAYAGFGAMGIRSGGPSLSS